MLGLTALLAKPQVIIGLIITSILALFILYFLYSQHEIKDISAKLAVQTIQAQQDAIVIGDLNKRLVLSQQLNDNYNKALSDIRSAQEKASQDLVVFNLPHKAIANAKQAETFLNNRVNQIFSNLNILSSHKVEKAK